nr:protein ELYS-like [Columba livia]
MSITRCNDPCSAGDNVCCGSVMLASPYTRRCFNNCWRLKPLGQTLVHFHVLTRPPRERPSRSAPVGGEGRVLGVSARLRRCLALRGCGGSSRHGGRRRWGGRAALRAGGVRGFGLHRTVRGGLMCNTCNNHKSALALLFHPATIKSVSWQHMRVLQSLMCQGEHRRALRYIQMMKPPVSSSSEVRLFLTVLLSNRCLVEAWGLLQQHTTKLNMEELLKHMYEICQEMGLMEDLLKLPFTETEQECLEKFLQTNAGVQSREFLLVHHLQRANYIPALQLHQSMKVNPTNDCDLQLRDKAVVRNAVLDQYGKILPRVQRKLAAERAELYHLPSSALREVSRPKPLSTVTKQANAENVCIFINNVLSKIGEVWVGNEQKPSFSQYDRLLHSVVHPVPSCSAAQGGCWQSPCGASASFMASSPLKSNLHSSISQRNFSGSTQLNLLETPPVVKVCNLRKLEEQSKPKACQLHLK